MYVRVTEVTTGRVIIMKIAAELAIMGYCYLDKQKALGISVKFL